MTVMMIKKRSHQQIILYQTVTLPFLSIPFTVMIVSSCSMCRRVGVQRVADGRKIEARKRSAG